MIARVQLVRNCISRALIAPSARREFFPRSQ
jgi:hypothetical protein